MSNEFEYTNWGATPGNPNALRNFAMPNQLRTLRLRAKFTQDALAKRMGTTRSQYVKLERGERKLTEEWIRRAATALGVPASALLERGTVPLIGKVGARGEVELLDVSQFGYAAVEAPPESSPSMVAVTVTTGPLAGIADEGWTLYYEDRHQPATDDLIGALCVLGLPDGRTVIRKLLRGRTPGLYHLHSGGGDPMFDQPVQWAARVAWIRPQ